MFLSETILVLEKATWDNQSEVKIGNSEYTNHQTHQRYHKTRVTQANRKGILREERIDILDVE